MKNTSVNDKTEFIERFNKYIAPRTGARGGEKLLAYLLQSDFFDAPASAIHHMAEQGGLCRHSLNVDDVLCELLFTPGTVWNQYAIDHNIKRENVATIALLHDLCKANFYIASTKNKKTYDTDKVAAADPRQVKKDNQGSYIWETVSAYEIDDKFPIGHGEKSLFMISQYINLTFDEIMAIRWHMGFSVPQQEWKTLNPAMDKCPLIIAMHLADITATHLLESEMNSYEVKTSFEGEEGDKEQEQKNDIPQPKANVVQKPNNQQTSEFEKLENSLGISDSDFADFEKMLNS